MDCWIHLFHINVNDDQEVVVVVLVPPHLAQGEQAATLALWSGSSPNVANSLLVFYFFLFLVCYSPLSRLRSFSTSIYLSLASKV